VTDQSSLISQNNVALHCQSASAFISTNNIVQQLIACDNDIFTIAETGFASGLNFLLTLKAYLSALQQTQKDINNKKLCKLHFISIEKSPLSKEELTQSLARFPELSVFIEPLLTQYPQSSSQHEFKQSIEYHTFVFLSGQVTLTLYFCDVISGLQSIESPKHGEVDVWYLNGFIANTKM